MAIDLLNRPTSGPDEDSRNPGQQHADDVFNALTSAEHMAQDGKSGDIGVGSEKGLFSADKDKPTGGAAGAAGGIAGAAASATPIGRLAAAKNFFWGSRGRKAATSGGGGLGAAVIALSLFSLFSAGPLEFVHIAQWLEQTHLSEQSDAQDGRMSKMYRFMKSNGNIGETRIGNISSKYNKQMLGDLKAIGIEPNFGAANNFESVTFDTAQDNKYKGMSKQEFADALKKEYGYAGSVTQESSGKYKASADGKLWGKSGTRGLSKTMIKQMDYNGLSTYLRTRVFRAYGWAIFHPLKPLDLKIHKTQLKAVDAFFEAREARLKTGVEAPTINADNAHDESTDKDGNKTETPASDDDKNAAKKVTESPSKAQESLKAIANSKGAKITGGLAMAQGIACLARTAANSIDEVRYAQVVVPLMRMGTETLSVGSQIMTGQDVDMAVVSRLSEQFNDTDKNGKLLSSWNQAESVQAENGTANAGVKTPATITDIGNSVVPGWLKWSQDKTLGPVCSTGGLIIGGIVSFGLSALSGGVASFIAGSLASIVAVPRLVTALSNWLAGDAVNLSARGAEWGSYVNYGTRLAANASSALMGGGTLSTKEVSVLDSERDSEDTTDFNSHTIAYKIFNTKDRRTLAAKAIDNSTAIQPANIASTVGSMFTHFGSLIKLPSGLFGSASAKSAPYDYGFPEFGFSQDELNAADVQDPYDNAEKVAKMLDDPSQFITIHDKVLGCFGVEISKDADGYWQAAPTKNVSDPSTFLNLYNKEYTKNNCRDKGNADWLRVRFFVLDNGVFDAWACVQGDDASCVNEGVSDASADGGSTGGSGIPGTSDTGDDYKGECSAYVKKYGAPLVCNGECVMFVLFRLLKHGVIDDSFVTGDGWHVAAAVAAKTGVELNHTPAVHAVVSWPKGGVGSGPGYHANASAGHTAMVAQVNADGSIKVEEYNATIPDHTYDTRTIPAGAAKLLDYAHVEKLYK